MSKNAPSKCPSPAGSLKRVGTYPSFWSQLSVFVPKYFGQTDSLTRAQKSMKKCNLFFESRISILALPLRQPRRTTTTSSSILARSTVTSTTATTSPRPQVFSSSHRSLSRPRRPFRHEMPTSLPSTTTTTTLACIRPSRLQLRLLTLLLTGVTS